jgi:O-antigen/teichoic acid export membrane protein
LGNNSWEDRISIRRVGTDAMTYGVGVVIRRLASFVMLPIYTRLLTPADYGLLELLSLSVEVVTILVSAGTTAGILRFFYKTDDEEERHRLMGSAFMLLGLLNALGAGILMALAGPIHDIVLGGQGEMWFIYIVAASFMLSPATEIPNSYMRAIRTPKRYVITNASILILQLSLNILFVVILRFGVLGVLLSTFLTAVASGSVLATWLFSRIGFSVSRSALKDLRRFAVPYQFTTAGGFLLVYGDRFFLQGFQGTEAVGIYSLAYKLGVLSFTLFARPFISAWSPQRFEIAHLPAEERDLRYNQGFRVLNVILIPGAVALAVGSGPLLRIMSDPSFFPAASVTPVVVLAYVVQAWTLVSRFGIDASERTIYQTYSVWGSVIVMLICYSTLIPLFGVMGAAVATLIGFLVRFAMTYRFAQRLWPIDVVWRSHVVTLSGGILVAGLGILGTSHSVSLILDILIAAAATVLATALSVIVLFDPSERRAILSVMKNLLRRALSFVGTPSSSKESAS